MAHVAPFIGLRYDPRRVDVAAVVAPPYDVVPPSLQQRYHDRDPYNVMQIELGLPEGPDAEGRDRYARATELLRRWLASGILVRERRPAVYVLEEQFSLGSGFGTRHGVFAAVGLEPWDRDIVLPHEHTLPKPKADRLSLLRATGTQISPILSFFDDPAHAVDRWRAAITARPPDVAVSVPGGAVVEAAGEQRLWVVTDPDATASLTRLLADQQLFIGDGHHRYETALAYQRERRERDGHGPWDDGMMLLVAADDPGLVILPNHRVVRLAAPPDRAALLERLEALFTVTWLPTSEAIRRFTVGSGDTAAAGEPGRHICALLGLRTEVAAVLSARRGSDPSARLPHDRSAAWRSLDVAIVHGLLLEPLLGLTAEQVSSQRFLTYERDAVTAAAALGTGADLVVLLPPTRVAQVRDVALAHDRMPQKSTFFYPKAVTGLVMYAAG